MFDRLNMDLTPVPSMKTEVKQLGPRLALGWVTIQGLDMDTVATNTVKSNVSFWGPKKAKTYITVKQKGQKIK